MVPGEYHAISAHCRPDGEVTIMHTKMDGVTKRVISEQLTPPPPAPWNGPWVWEEVLMLGTLEVCERRSDWVDRLRL